MLFGSLSLEYWKVPILLKRFSPASAMIFWEPEFEFKSVRQRRECQRQENIDQHLGDTCTCNDNQCAQFSCPKYRRCFVRTAGGWDLSALQLFGFLVEHRTHDWKTYREA